MEMEMEEEEEEGCGHGKHDLENLTLCCKYGLDCQRGTNSSGF